MLSGCLVTKRHRWDISANILGVTIEPIDDEEEKWLVLWAVKGGKYKLQKHMKSALLVIDGTNDERVKERICVSM